jgi:hypothetical protein
MSCWAARAAARSSPRPERISISEAISSPEIASARPGSAELLEASHHLQALGIEDRELLLQPDGEIRRGLEGRPGGVEIALHAEKRRSEGQGLQSVR